MQLSLLLNLQWGVPVAGVKMCEIKCTYELLLELYVCKQFTTVRTIKSKPGLVCRIARWLCVLCILAWVHYYVNACVDACVLCILACVCCVYLHGCIFMWMHVCILAYIYFYVNACVYVWDYICVCVCVCSCVFVCACLCVCVFIWVRVTVFFFGWVHLLPLSLCTF